MTEAHVKFVKAHEAHSRSSGCIIYCMSQYVEGHPHSHRWHAANQARGESRVPYNDYKLWESQEVNNWSEDQLKALDKEGGLDGPITQAGGKHLGKVKPFYREFHPFNHNGHHIIPSSNIEECIDKAVAKAAPNEGRMKDLVVGGLLTEPYNNNDQPNMIVLPTRLRDSQILGLPIHTDGQADHPDYRTTAGKQIKGKFQSAYRSLAAAVAAEVHPKDQKVPTLGPALVAISRQNYEAMIAMAMSRASAGKSLDTVRRQVLRMASRRMAG